MRTNTTIDALVDRLEPVRPISAGHGMIWIGALLVGAIALVIGIMGPRPDLLAGNLEPIFLLRAGVLLLLGTAAGYAVLSMASPAVGKGGRGWAWALAGALIFPLAATIVVLTGAQAWDVSGAGNSVMECLGLSVIAGGATAVPMVLWLRRGAPASPERAGLLTGIAAGGLGAFAYNFHCPFNDIVYIGLWYTLAVGICAAVGRAVVPPLVRW